MNSTVMGLPPTTAYITYLNFFESICVLFFQIATIVTLINFLYTVKYRPHRLLCHVKGISRTMLIFLSIHLLNSLISVPYHTYLVMRWHPPNGKYVYEADYLYWLGLFTQNYFVTAPVALFFLTLDRFLTMRVNVGYKEQWRSVLVVADLVVVVAMYGFNSASNLIELPLSYTDVVQCETFACLGIRYKSWPQLLMKVTLATANLILSACFFYQLKYNSARKNIKNRVVKVTMACELLFNVTPGYIFFLYLAIQGKTLTAYTGQLATFFCSLDALVCSVFYSHVMLMFRKRTSTSVSEARSSSNNIRTGSVRVCAS